MSFEILMPRLSDQMEEGTVIRWVRSIGEEVRKGDELLEIETDKATWMVESEIDGVLVEILTQDGGIAAVGSLIGLIGGSGESAPETPAKESHPTEDAPPSTKDLASSIGPKPALQGPVNTANAGRRPRATPMARRRAVDLGIALSEIAGTGPYGRIVLRDVNLFAASKDRAFDVEVLGSSDRGRGVAVPLTTTQRTIARRMVEATASVPHFFVSAEIDMTRAVELRAEWKMVDGATAPSLNDLVVKACAMALRELPAANASWNGDTVLHWPRVNVGVAVAIPDAVVVPVVIDADRKSVAQIAAETKDLAVRAHALALTPNDLANGTFTVSNLGMLGVRSFSAVINPPQVAILAVGEVERRAVVSENGRVVPAHRMDVTLSADHRVLYGADGAQFLARVRALLEQPLALIL